MKQQVLHVHMLPKMIFAASRPKQEPNFMKTLREQDLPQSSLRGVSHSYAQTRSLRRSTRRIQPLRELVNPYRQGHKPDVQ